MAGYVKYNMLTIFLQDGLDMLQGGSFIVKVGIGQNGHGDNSLNP